MAANGFDTYFIDYKITQEFIGELEHLCRVIYGRWSLRVTEEDFYGFCLERVVDRLPHFDGKRGTIQNYVYTIVLNEARRIWSKERRVVNVEDDVLDVLPVQGHTSALASLVYALHDFARRAWDMGVYVGQVKVLSDVQSGVLSPEARAFHWLRETGRL